MKERILGSIGVLWGVAILIYGLVGNHHDRFSSNSSYQAGETAALVFGVLFLIVGARAVIKSLR